MTELYKLFEKDSLSDLLALTNIAKRISGNKEILINFNQNSRIAFTDGSFIYLPRNTKDDIKSAQGLVAHESGHIGYGSFELSFTKLVKTISSKYRLPEFLVKKITNVVEDVRINMLNNIKFPGFYRNLRELTRKMLPELKLIMKKTGDILIYINLFMEEYKEFQKKPRFRTKSMSDQDWRAIRVAKTFLLKTLTPASSIIAIDQLSKVLKKYYIKKTIRKPPPKPSNSSQREFQELLKDVYFDSDEIDLHSDKPKLSLIKDSKDILEVDDDLDIMEDPFYFDESDYQKSQNFNGRTQEPLMNHFEDFSDPKEIFEKSELDKTSDKIIDKIKDSSLSTEDIEKLIEEVDRINEDSKEIPNLDLDNELESLKGNLINANEILESNLDIELNNSDMNDTKARENLMELPSDIFNELKADGNELEKGNYLEEFIKLVSESHIEMEDRLFILDKGISFEKFSKGQRERKVSEVQIENETMKPIIQSYNQIIGDNRSLIARIKFIFRDFKNQIENDHFQKRGRLNSKFIKAVTSDYKYIRCFSRKIKQKELKILLMVDISGSMRGKKLESAKIAMIMLCEALYGIAQLRIVLFTGDYDAINILLKDFNDKPDPKKFDKFGCHDKVCSNLDGISIKHEAAKLDKNVLIIVISDGQPAGSGNYGLYDAIKEVHDVKKIFNLFAFSIDAQGDYLDKLYDKNWVLTKSADKTDLGDKLIKFCKLVVKEFFR
ncbi:hypothetical protein LCGC14_0837520 [marine sediment metagenome]|uniref:VWFA domain-containing protein n=1 Tax=marine sediment metagenome TaxID=412755 RepID=A0A0F9PE47_9ZZZZ